MRLLSATHQPQLGKVGGVLALALVLALRRGAAQVGEDVAGLLAQAPSLGLLLRGGFLGVRAQSRVFGRVCRRAGAAGASVHDGGRGSEMEVVRG